MKSPRLIVDKSLPYLRPTLDTLADALYLPAQEITREAILSHKAEGLLVRSVCHCNEELLEGSSVRFIATATAGIEHIDQAYCRAKRIWVENAPGCNARSVAQYLFTALSERALVERKHVATYLLGVVGVGNVGTQVLRYADAFGMMTIMSDPPRAEKEGISGFLAFEEVLAHADIVTFHVPFSREAPHATFHMVNKSTLSAVRKKPLFVNAARGAIVDTPALVEALDEGAVRGAIIDCWEGEPYISLELLSRSDRATPHIAGFSADSKARGSRMVCDAMCHFFGIMPPSSGLSYATPAGGADNAPYLSQISPPSPNSPYIDASSFGDFTLEEVMCRTMALPRTEKILREAPRLFEQHRVNYHFHREPEAFIVTGAAKCFHESLRLLGFHLA